MRHINPFVIFWRLPAELKVLFVAIFINRMGMMVLPFLALYLTHSLQFSYNKAGFIVGLFGVGALITDFACSWWLDKLNIVTVMIASLFISAIAILIFPLFHSFAAIVILILVWAMANEAMRPASLAITSEMSSPTDKKTVFSINRLAVNLGMSIGPAIAGLVVAKSFVAIFMINGIATLFSGLLLWKKLPRENLSHKRHAEKSNELFATPEISVFRDKHFFYFLLATLPVFIVYMQHNSTLSIFMVRDLHLSAFYYGLMFSISTLMIVFFEIPINALTSHWPDKRNLLLGSTLITVGFGALVFVNNFAGILLTTFVWTIGEIFLFPAEAAYVGNTATMRKHRSYMAIYSASINVGLILSPWIGMAILEDAGSNVLWISCFVISLFSVVLFWRLKNRRLK